MTKFPSSFLWGSATAGHQVEGGNVGADIWPLEWAAESLFAEPSGDACDHYHRYPEDIALMAELGLNAYRFSLEWSRIEPESGYFSRAALDHYRRMIDCCWDNGITPIVTYNHFTLPRWLAGRGGWSATEAPARFGEFAARATERLADALSWVCTLNEPNLMALLSSTGPFALREESTASPTVDPVVAGAYPDTDTGVGVGGYDAAHYRMGLISANVAVMAEAHRQAKAAVKAIAPKVNVGWTLALVDLQVAPDGDSRLEQARRISQGDWLAISRDDDFVGVQTYTRERIGPEGTIEPGDGVPVTQTGWEVYPDALGHTVRRASELAGVPILVTENGMATDDDEARIEYTRGALEGLAGAVADGVDVRGYLHWSFLDNFEWTAGFAKTFGLVAVDPSDFSRTVKPSARWLGQVARKNQLPQ